MVISFRSTLSTPSNRMEQVMLLIRWAIRLFSISKGFSFSFFYSCELGWRICARDKWIQDCCALCLAGCARQGEDSKKEIGGGTRWPYLAGDIDQCLVVDGKHAVRVLVELVQGQYAIVGADDHVIVLSLWEDRCRESENVRILLSQYFCCDELPHISDR